MPRSWNGFNTNPHTLSDQCSICSGATGGDFFTLSCGHGASGHDPLHIKCLIQSFAAVDPDQPMPPRCPICRTGVDQDALGELVRSVRRNAVVDFPDEHDQHQQERLCATFDETVALIENVSHAQRLAEGGNDLQPTAQERDRTYWENFSRNAMNLASVIEQGEEMLFYTAGDFERKQNELSEEKERLVTLIERANLFRGREDALGVNPRVLSYQRVVREYTAVGRSLERVTHILEEGKKALRTWESEKTTHTKKIWNGFDTAPQTPPSACTVCAGGKGGEFVVLDCGHGSPDQGPLHVRCVLNQVVEDTKDQNPAHCPTCQEDIESNTLSRLAFSVRRNGYIEYPAEDGSTKNTHLCTSLQQQCDEIDALIHAQTIQSGQRSFGPEEEEFEDTYYEHLIDGATSFVQRVQQNIGEHTYTPEELEKAQFQLGQLQDRMVVAAGRTAQYEGGATVWYREEDVSFEEIYRRLRVVLDHIETADTGLRQEKEAIEKQAEQGSSHKDITWNGFQTEPETRPNACVVCFGEKGGDFVTLDCGHGGPGNDPLHVRCALDVVRGAMKDGAVAQCPVCQDSIREETLSRLADCARRNGDVRYPGDDGMPITGRLFDDPTQQLDAIEGMARAQEIQAERHAVPSADDAHDTTYNQLIETIERLVAEVSWGIEERSYTLEELEEKQGALEELECRAVVAAEQMETSSRDPSYAESDRAQFEEKSKRLLEARERLEKAQQRADQEKEEMGRREEEGEQHVHAPGYVVIGT